VCFAAFDAEGRPARFGNDGTRHPAPRFPPTDQETAMDKENLGGAIDEHSQAEGELDRIEGTIQQALHDLEDVSRHMKEKIADEKDRREFPVDDDPPGDVEDQPRASNP